MSKDDFFAWLLTGAGIEDEKVRLDILAKAEDTFSLPALQEISMYIPNVGVVKFQPAYKQPFHNTGKNSPT